MAEFFDIHFEEIGKTTKIPIDEERTTTILNSYITYSHEHWVPIELDIPAKADEIRLLGEIFQNGLPDSKIGFFTPYEDLETVERIGTGQYAYPESDYVITVADWKFGTDAFLLIKKRNQSKNIQENRTKLKIYLCLVAGSFSSQQNHNFNGEIKFNMKCFDSTKKDIAEPVQRTLKFSVTSESRELRKPSSTDMLERLERLNALRLSGNGNSIHPKQAVTSDAIVQFIKSQEKPVSIGYIGTDTTENLRSMIRVLCSHELNDKIDNLYIFIDQEWDREILRELQGQHSLDEINQKFNNVVFVDLLIEKEEDTRYTYVDYHKNSEIQTIEDYSIDLMVATYVAPWAQRTHFSTARYKNLLEDFRSKENGYILSVDPSSSESIVRSNLFEKDLQIDAWYRANCSVNFDIMWKNRFKKSPIIDARMYKPVQKMV